MSDSTRERCTEEKPIQAEASKQWLTHVEKEFNSETKRAVDGAIYGIMGRDVLKAFHELLKERYHLTPDQIPHRVDAVFEILEHTFGFKGARTISRAIAKRLYYRLNLQLVERPDYTLQDYLEQAKKELKLQTQAS